MDQAKTKILQKRVDEQEATIKDFSVVLRKLVDFNGIIVEQQKKIEGLMACNNLVVDVEKGQRKSIENLRRRIDALEKKTAEMAGSTEDPVDQGDVYRSYH